MLSTYEKTGSGIIYKAARDLAVPNVDILTFLFDSEWSDARDDTVLHVDATEPTKALRLAELRRLTKRMAHFLRHAYGIGANGPGCDVAVAVGGGHWQLPTVFYATLAAGGVFSPASPAATTRELANQLEAVEAAIVFCTPETRDVAVEAAREARVPAESVLVLGHGPGFELIRASGEPVALPAREHEWARPTDPKTLAETVVCVPFSSGTTGLPKGVMLSHANLVSEAFLVQQPTKEWDRKNRPDFVVRTLAHLPPAHIAGLMIYYISTMLAGGTVYWMPRFDFALFLEYCRRYRITSFFSVPPVFLAIAKSPLVTDQLDSVQVCVGGAAPLAKDLQAAAQKKIGQGRTLVTQVWGLTETCGAITTMPSGMSDASGSVATLLANCTARIVDEQHKDVEPGQAGEIWVRGPVVTKGYYKNPVATADAFVGGWFCTGDIGLFKDGLFYIVDRKKELIKYKGLQVAPSELEAMLVSHPKIQDAAVIGVPREDTEVPR